MRSVLIIDDHPIVRHGVGRLLSDSIGDLRVVGAENVAEATAHVGSDRWDMVVLDLRLGEDDGLALLRTLRKEIPATPVLIVSMYPAEQFEARVLASGAAAYIEKAEDPEHLVAAVRALLGGHEFRSPRASRGDALPSETPHDLLSDREYQVLRMIGSGRTVSEIAADLTLSVKTVSTYRARILEKMRFRTNAELMRYVIERRLVQ